MWHVLFQHVLSLAAELTKPGNAGTWLQACYSWPALQEATAFYMSGWWEREKIYHWNNSILDLLLKMLSLVLLQRTETEGQGGGWTEQGMHSADLLMLCDVVWGEIPGTPYAAFRSKSRGKAVDMDIQHEVKREKYVLSTFFKTCHAFYEVCKPACSLQPPPIHSAVFHSFKPSLLRSSRIDCFTHPSLYYNLIFAF